MRRFYLPGLPSEFCENAVISALPPLELTGQEARHLALVLRLGTGDKVEFFDGAGHVLLAQILKAEPDRVCAQALELREEDAAATPKLVLAQALLKGRKMDLVVQKANELGAAAFVPLVTRFCEKREAGPATLARWSRIVIESCKQCGRVRPLEFGDTFPGLEEADFSWAAVKLVAWEGEHAQGLPVAELHRATGPICLVIGPEGGLAPDEVARLQARGFQPFSLGTQILRAETAALAAMSVLRYLTGGLGPLADDAGRAGVCAP